MNFVRKIFGVGAKFDTGNELSSATNGPGEDEVDSNGNHQEPVVEENNDGESSARRQEGIITVLEESIAVGVINHEFKFKKTDLKHPLKRGMAVSFIAKRERGSADCVAVDIKPVVGEKEKILQERARHKVLNFKVIKVDDESVLVGKDEGDMDPIRFGKELVPGEYRVVKGDWLTVEFEAVQCEDGEVDQSRAKVIRVNWIEKAEVKGKVTRTDGFICINDTIYFTQDVVKNQTSLKMGDAVRAVVVASDQEEKTSSLRRIDGEVCTQFCFRKRAVEVIYEKPEPLELNSEEDEWLGESKGSRSSMDNKIETLLENKNGIKVRPGGYLRFDDVVIRSSTSKTVLVDNYGSEPVILKRIEFFNVQDVCEFSVECGNENGWEERVILPRVPYVIKIHCKGKQLGRTKELCIFDFGPDGQICRWLMVTSISGDEAFIRRSRPSGAVEHWRKTNENMSEMAAQMIEDRKRGVIAGPKLFRTAFFIPNRIESYRIPNHMQDIYCSEDIEALTERYPIDFQQLNAENYVTRFQVSLWLEEIENQVMRTKFDLHNVVMHPTGENMVLAVPTFKEIYPPVLIGDQVEVIDSSVTDKKFTASIEKIVCYELAPPEIHLRFNQTFVLHYRCTPVDRVRFLVGRSGYRRQHFAVITSVKHLGPDWLFPERLVLKPPRVKFFEVAGDDVHPAVEASKILKGKNLLRRGEKVCQLDTEKHRALSLKGPFDSNVQLPSELSEFRLRWYNPSLNKEQKDAVRRILSAQGRPLPYVIFGPPGTGKTVTVVEAILQIYFLERTSRILVTVPSNAGADLISEQLASTCLFKPGDFVRLNGFLRADLTVPETIADFCVDGTHLDSVAKHRLIICTVATAGQFFQLNLNTGHFSHVFIDEAGYCTEPEALIPSVLAAINKEAVVVLAGDPQQLGPVLMNDMTINEFMKISLLERMMGTTVYERNEVEFPETKYNPAVLTKLVRSYRAHPHLLKVPSELFYNDELVSCAGQEAYEFCDKDVDFLMKSDVPLIFHGIKGDCSQDRDSPSWYNIAEVSQVAHYVRKLRGCGVASEDIGIITPYRKQVEKLRLALQYRMLDDEVPKIASVQEFQGGERKVIIISTVRSDYEDILNQKLSRLDFLYSKKLFNVAVTRAKALMIIVGNPDVLHLNDYWSRLLQYCIDLGVYTGCNLPSSLNQRLQNAVEKLNVATPPLVFPEEEEGPDFPDGEEGYHSRDNVSEFPLS